jgi:hypothetical protein
MTSKFLLLLAQLSGSADSISRAAKYVLSHATDARELAYLILEKLHESETAKIPLLYLFDCISQRAATAKMNPLVTTFGDCLLEVAMIFLPLNRPAVVENERVIAKVAKIWKQRKIFSMQQLDAVERAFEAHAAAKFARATTSPPESVSNAVQTGRKRGLEFQEVDRERSSRSRPQMDEFELAWEASEREQASTPTKAIEIQACAARCLIPYKPLDMPSLRFPTEPISIRASPARYTSHTSKQRTDSSKQHPLADPDSENDVQIIAPPPLPPQPPPPPLPPKARLHNGLQDGLQGQPPLPIQPPLPPPLQPLLPLTPVAQHPQQYAAWHPPTAPVYQLPLQQHQHQHQTPLAAGGAASINSWLTAETDGGGWGRGAGR